MSVIPSDIDVQDEQLRRVLSDLHTCMPAEVVAVRSSDRDQRQFVDALPLQQREVVDENGEPISEAYPVLQMVPVGYVQGGGFFMSVPLRIGDVVLLVFAERSLDSWIENAIPGAHSPVVPGDLSQHSLQGAIALPLGPAPRATLLTGVDATDMVIGTDDGTILARFTAGGDVIFAEGTQFVALANLVATELTRIQSDLAALKSATNAGFNAGGTPGTGFAGAPAMVSAFAGAAGAVPSSPASVAATKTKAT